MNTWARLVERLPSFLLILGKIRVSIGNEVSSEFGFILWTVVFRSQSISDEEGWLEAAGRVGLVPALAQLWDQALRLSGPQVSLCQTGGTWDFMCPSAGWTLHNSKDPIHADCDRKGIFRTVLSWVALMGDPQLPPAPAFYGSQSGALVWAPNFPGQFFLSHSALGLPHYGIKCPAHQCTCFFLPGMKSILRAGLVFAE